MGLVRWLDQMIEKLTVGLLVSAVAAMLAFSVATIVLRWFELSFLWLDPLVRHLVFITTFLGGVIATGRGTHIGIDILSKTLELRGMDQAMRWVQRVISLASCGTMIWLIQASLGFLEVELEFGKVAFLGIHSGVLVGIIPVGFGLIALRFALRFIQSFSTVTEESPC